MADKEVFRILFKVTPGVLKLISPETDSGAAEEEIPCRYDGQNITIAMNFVYVTEPLKVIDTENVVVEFNVDENREDEGIVIKAVIIRSEPAADYIHVVAIKYIFSSLLSFSCAGLSAIFSFTFTIFFVL